jgi:predicted secreted protein
MDWFTGTVVFILIWWTALFCVLPIGTRPVEDPDPEAGGWRGAPAKPLLGRKLIGTTVLAGVLWLGVYAVVASGWVSFRDGWWAYQGPGVSSPLPGRAQN